MQLMYEPAIARCIMKYFMRDRLLLFVVTIDRKMAMFPTTIAMNRTIRNIICSFCTVIHNNIQFRRYCLCQKGYVLVLVCRYTG